MMRSVVIDALRGVAILLVLGAHSLYATQALPSSIRIGVYAMRHVGWAGVDLFFVLSGFLVAGLLFEESRRTEGVRVGRFLLRRGLKVYPALWAMLAFTWWWHPFNLPLSRYLVDASFLASYMRGTWMHLWSLAVEEHFYLTLAALVGVLAPRRALAWIPSLCATTCVLVLAGRVAAAPSSVPHVTHLRADALACGVLLAWLWAYRREGTRALVRARRRELAGSSILLLLPVVVLSRESVAMATWGLTTTYLGMAALLMLTVVHEPRWRALEPLAIVGRYSYSIYLWHLVVLLAGGPYAWTLGPWVVVAYPAAAVATGMVAGWCVEMPVLWVRDRWVPGQQVRRLRLVEAA